MQKDYKFSIITPFFNTENYIGEAIESIINQSINFNDNVQLILIDDGSTDGASDIVRKYAKDPHVKAIFQKNQGIAGISDGTQNTGADIVD